MRTQSSLISETSAIACFLTSDSSIDEYAQLLAERDFLNLFLRDIFCSIITMKKQNSACAVDAVTVSNFLSTKNNQDENEILGKIIELFRAPYVVANLKHYIEIIKEESKKRQLDMLMSDTREDMYAGKDMYYENLKAGIANLDNNSPYDIVTFPMMLEKTMKRIEEDIASGKKIRGLPTGFSDIDEFINGLQKSDLIILAARPSVGKTTLMLNIADAIARRQELTTVFFSLEMSDEQISSRMLSTISRIEGNAIMKSQLSDAQFEKISQSIIESSKSRLIVNDRSRLSVHQMRSFCRRVKSDLGLSAIFVDHIGLMDGEGENETLRIGAISRDLKAMAKDFNVPVFVLSQLNRGIEKRQDKTPQLQDINQSGHIEQNADVVMFLTRDEKEPNEAFIKIAKNRNGPVGDIKLSVDLNYFEFTDYKGFSTFAKG